MRRRSIPSHDPAPSVRLLEEACREHRPWVEALARRQVEDATLAEEVTQDVFLKLSQLPAPPRDAAALRAWLLRCVWYVAANARRKRARHQRMMAAFARQGCDDTSPRQETFVETEELEAALTILPALERTLLLQHFFEGRSHAEIGACHALSAEATRKRIARALRRLHRWLERRGHPLSLAAVAAGLGASPSAVAALTSGAALGATTFFTTMTTTKTAVLTTAACLGLAIIPWLHQQRRISALQAQLTESAAARITPPQPPSPAPTVAASASPAEWAADVPESLRHVMSAWPRIMAAPPGQPNQALIDTLAVLLRDPDATQRQAAFTMLCGLLRTEDLDATQQLFAAEEKRGVLRVPEYTALCFRQGQLLGREALVAKVGDPPLAPLDRLSAALLEGWASRDPEEVYAWLEQLPEGFDFRTHAFQPFFLATLRNHPEIARQMAEKASAPVARAMLQAMALREVDTGGVEALESWFHALPERENWRETRADLAFLLAERQSFASAEAAVRTLQAGWDQPWGGEALAKKIAARFGRVNEGKVLAMLDILPVDSPVAVALADTLFSTMAEHQWNVAADFFTQHPEFPHYDRAVTAFVEGIRAHNPEIARAWAGTLKDAAHREALLEQLEP